MTPEPNFYFLQRLDNLEKDVKEIPKVTGALAKIEAILSNLVEDIAEIKSDIKDMHYQVNDSRMAEVGHEQRLKSLETHLDAQDRASLDARNSSRKAVWGTIAGVIIAAATGLFAYLGLK